MGLFDKLRKKDNTILNIEKTDVIDALAASDDGSALIMVILDGMDWHDEHRHLILLQEKINNYIAYIESKQYTERYPSVTAIEINVKFLFKETENCNAFLRVVLQTLNESLPNTALTVEHGVK